MPTRWVLLEANEDERAQFAELERVRELPFEPAGPRNRHRHVRCIELAGRRYFLKVFERTQQKNRWRHRLTAPRSLGGSDAEREASIARLLRARGVDVARPVAFGHDGAASYYLCAELPGASVAELRRRGAWRADDDVALARFCGGIARSGVVLTDLSADHVFVADAPGGPRFAVIDLHNGRRRVRPTRREATRMLRRFARSVAELSIERRRALRFAVRTLRVAGLPRPSRRRAVERVPPQDTHGRYDDAQRSRRYATRNRSRHTRELELLDAVWPARPGESVLDVPCGAGRLAAFARARGQIWHGADRSIEMLREARGAAADASLALCDAAVLPFAERSFDGVVVFRFLHHLSEIEALRVVDAAARTAERFVVLSFFHPLSFHNLGRAFGRRFGGQTTTRYAIWPRTLDVRLASHGFRRSASAAHAAYRRDLWLCAYERVN